MEENTYFVTSDTLSADIARLNSQSAIFNQYRPVLSEVDGERLEAVKEVLDVGCGPGDWALTVCQRYEYSVTGIDKNPEVIAYADATARSRGMASYAKFITMDVLQGLSFSDDTFDLVHARFTVSFHRKDTYALMLAEMYRVLKPGGIVVWTECDEMGRTNSLAYETLKRYMMEGGDRDNRVFDPLKRNLGITLMQRRLMEEAGFGELHEVPGLINFSPDTPFFATVRDDILVMTQLVISLSQQQGAAVKEFEELRNQTIIDFYRPDFIGQWWFLTVWGSKPLVAA